MSDQEAWHELCNLYMAEGEFAKAAFCMEELLLHNPHSHLYHQRLAEIRYTMVSSNWHRSCVRKHRKEANANPFSFDQLQGGLENIEIAKTYYSQAVKLNPNNLRALYGLYLVFYHVPNQLPIELRLLILTHFLFFHFSVF